MKKNNFSLNHGAKLASGAENEAIHPSKSNKKL